MQRLKNKPFFKSILILASGSFAAHAITALAMPILSRLYAPDVMGKYTYIISVATIFLSVINGRYDVAIVTEEEQNNVFPLIKLSLIIGLAVSVITTISFGTYFFFSGKEVWMALYVFLILLSYAIVDVFTAYNNRQKEYKTISSVYLLRTSVQNFISIAGGFISNSVHFLAFPYALGLFAGLRRQMRPIKPYLNGIFKIPSKEIVRVAKIHYRQPLFSAPALLANSLSYSLVTIFMEALYGLQQVGYYSVSVRLLGLPLALVGANVSKVYVEQASKDYHQSGSYRKVFKKTFLLLLIIFIPILFIILCFATPICTSILGKEWESSGAMISILAPMFGFRLITSAMSPSLVIVNKQKLDLGLQSLFLLSNVSCFIFVKIEGLEILDYLKLLSFFFSCCYATYLFFIYKYSKKKVNHDKENCNTKCC